MTVTGSRRIRTAFPGALVGIPGVYDAATVTESGRASKRPARAIGLHGGGSVMVVVSELAEAVAPGVAEPPRRGPGRDLYFLSL